MKKLFSKYFYRLLEWSLQRKEDKLMRKRK